MRRLLLTLGCACLLSVLVNGQTATKPAPKPPAPAAQSPISGPNAEVVELVKKGISEATVLSFVKNYNGKFNASAKDILALHNAGVSDAVIDAMVAKNEAPAAQPAPVPPAPPPVGVVPAAATSEEYVMLRASQKETRLNSVLGDTSTTYAVVTMLVFLDFPGLKADLRITDPRPVLVVRINKSPRGRVFLVRCKSNEGDNNRSVKVGKAGPFGAKSWNSPDGDWTVEFDTKELPGNTWEITPKRDLAPGEYGLLFRGGFFGGLAVAQGELFDFGVDR
jgi:hypothetical protein